ncbi:2-keto-4-pentenoate hydratase [Vineibacter terrae]|uniref:2-keto-4-pentenoate hydratase n=1 Tax=Vineibacter terrae TaxID=2586908 RepID=A0A5C8PH97_9HYPH|nr:fumarylacetoacetate hydrolase family protein [Vineibacter terrae]TXL72715.1 2-keto-4-pentenoate hydratase [Vineibacter terrae]
MTASDIDHAAQALLQARRSFTQIAPPGPAPADTDAVYAIQDKVAAALGPVEGWKVGAPSPTAMPTCAPLLAGHVALAPASFAAGSMHMLGVEAEVAFRFARDLPAAATAPDADAVLDAVGSAHVVIEVVDTRLANWKSLDPLWPLADNAMNKALVVGPAFAGWRGLDYDRQPVRLTVDGKAVVDRAGGNSGGSPLRLLTWLAGHVVTRRGGLRAGQVVTTGSWVGLQFVSPGATVVAAFAGLGETQVTFPA